MKKKLFVVLALTFAFTTGIALGFALSVVPAAFMMSGGS
jgi:hypothetical protein